MSSEYIFGIHDFGGEEHMRAARKPGWIVFSEVLGHDPNDLLGKDYSSFSRQGLGVIVCLNNGYFPQGTLPLSSEYANFARRCANFVDASRGCSQWVIGNEMNYAIGRPSTAEGLEARKHVGETPASDPMLRSLPDRFSALLNEADREIANEIADGEELITPQLYASCYGMCRQAIHELDGHEKDQVLIGAVAPWNSQTMYAGNPNGDWIKYFQDILLQCGASGCDGITLHTYTHGANPTLILDNSKLPDFPQFHCHFQAYRDFMHAIPVNMRHLPVYITETDQGGPWENVNRGWIQAAYAEIDRWNRQNAQKIRALALYRWPQLDRWHIKGKGGVIEDFRVALRHDYRWGDEAEQPVPASKPERWPAREARGRQEVEDVEEVEVTEEMKSGRGMVYRVQWLKGKPPSPLHAGQRVNFPVTVRNTGTIAWPAAGAQQVALGYHFFQNRREVPFPDDRPVLTELPHDVAPGETVTFDAQMVIPDRPGNFTLVLDLISGGENWFQDMQSDILTRWLNVSEAQPQTDETKQAAPAEDTAALQDRGSADRTLPPETTPELKVRAEASSSTAPQGPAVLDIASSLPRGENQFAMRTPDQIRRLVICHTSAPTGVPIQTIAQAHISQGYPGIAYHYFVLETGEILQVAGVEAVVNDEAEWSLTGVNICLEGNFDEDIPPPAQLTAAAQLCASILPRFHLTAQSVVGMCELLDTSSPGSTFDNGPAWKRELHEKIVKFLTDSPLSPPSETVDDETPLLPDDSPAASHPEKTPAPRPPIEDVVTRLPRDPQRFVPRQADDIEFIVVNHTAAPPITPLQTIAAAFHRRLPGILYQFFIASNGSVYQTQPLMQVVDGKVPYIARAINIGFAGEFNDDIPTPAQIKSGRELISWLMEEFPQLTLASIRGVNEFINHTSPGEQWLQGRRWKDILIDAVRTGAEGPAIDEATSAGEEFPGLRGQQPLRNGRAANSGTAASGRENDQMSLGDLDERGQPIQRVRVARPQIRDISHELPRHPTVQYRRRQLAAITHIAIHHTALPPSVGPERIAQAHVAEDLDRGKKAWSGIGYHYFIPVDGEILQTQPVDLRTFHVGRHNSYTIGVVFAGSFMNGSTPTARQIHSAARLIAWLLQEFQLQISNVLGHQEFSDNSTACPGSEWLEGKVWRDTLIAEIERVQSGVPPYHYVLFPTEETMTATMAEASNYFDEFKPEAGTFLEDALQARYVTLVESGTGPSAEAERRLANAGVEIDRLDDSDAISATQRLLQLAHDGRRFRSLLES